METYRSKNKEKDMKIVYNHGKMQAYEVRQAYDPASGTSAYLSNL